MGFETGTTSAGFMCHNRSTDRRVSPEPEVPAWTPGSIAWVGGLSTSGGRGGGIQPPGYNTPPKTYGETEKTSLAMYLVKEKLGHIRCSKKLSEFIIPD